MTRDIPFLLNHDAAKPIGIWGRDGIGEFNPDQRITREMLFEMLGGAGVRILESFLEDGVIYVRAFEIMEFSLVNLPAMPNLNLESQFNECRAHLQAVTNVLAHSRVPQNMKEAALQVTITIGPILKTAQDYLAKHPVKP